MSVGKKCWKVEDVRVSKNVRSRGDYPGGHLRSSPLPVTIAHVIDAVD